MKYLYILVFSFFALFSTAQNFNDPQLKVTRYQLNPEELDIQEAVDTDKISLKTYYLKDSSIVSQFQYFAPKENEIMFFYGKNEKTNKPEMYFKVHRGLRKIYRKKDKSRTMKVVEILKHNVFPLDDNFCSTIAFEAVTKLQLPGY